jgi:hypothetical protein
LADTNFNGPRKQDSKIKFSEQTRAKNYNAVGECPEKMILVNISVFQFPSRPSNL